MQELNLSDALSAHDNHVFVLVVVEINGRRRICGNLEGRTVAKQKSATALGSHQLLKLVAHG